ncbi:MAG: PHP domain-containing protein [Thermodesulfobacteriota bacterium]|nr:PHP domain-containing protein [Thermodesulfobacteriota bacterium]
MHLKGQLHIHTTYSDGRLTPQKAADVYAGLGFDFIAFTDHDHLLKPSYRKAIDAVKADLIVFYGIELTVFEKGYVHVNRIEGDSEVLHVFNHPADYDLNLKQTIERINAIARQYPLDAVEVTDHGFYTPEFDVPEIDYPKVASDDSHTRTGCGRAWIELECKKDKDSILRAIKEGASWNCYERGLKKEAVENNSNGLNIRQFIT